MSVEAPYPYLQESRFQDAIAGRAPWPARYCMRGIGNCMEPYCQDRWTAVMSSDAPIMVGDVVAIFLTPQGRAETRLPQTTVKRIAKMTFTPSDGVKHFYVTSDNITGQAVRVSEPQFHAMHKVIDCVDVPWPDGLLNRDSPELARTEQAAARLTGVSPEEYRAAMDERMVRLGSGGALHHSEFVHPL